MKIPIITPIWNYFKDSWEGPDGKFSYRRATQFIWTWAMIYMIVTARQAGGMTKFEFYSFLTIAILWVLTAGMLSFEQLFRVAKLTLPGRLRRTGGNTEEGNIPQQEPTAKNLAESPELLDTSTILKE